jgi:excisionase family DNA binding protein
LRSFEPIWGAAMTERTWLTVEEAAERARCGVKLVYREVKAGRLRAAKLGGRRELRFLPEWVDQWLLASTAMVEQINVS